MIKELKTFLLRGNIVDLAVAVIIGSAFGSIVTSLADDVITPIFLTPALKAAGAENIAKLNWNGIAYGNFLSAVLNFLVVGTVLFFVVKATEKSQVFTKKSSLPKKTTGQTEIEILQDIRALLEKKCP